MEPEQAVYQKLSATASLTALVSTRIYPDEADPDADRPLVVYGVTGREPMRSLSGAVGITRYTVMVAAEADNFDTLKAVVAAVRTALDNTVPTGTKGSYETDYSTGETDFGFESLQSFDVWM